MLLRIAVLSRNFATTGGGAERYSIAIVEHLATRHEVHVFAQNIEHDFPGVTYHRVPTPMNRPRWINQLYFALATWRATRKGFDIVHSHENTWHGNIQTVHVLPIRHNLFANKSGLNLILRWLKVMTSPRLIAYLWLEWARYRTGNPRRIVLASNSLKEVMVRAYPNAVTCMSVVTPGLATVPGASGTQVKLAARRALGLPDADYGILLVGNDFRKKGVPAAIGTLKALGGSRFLMVVGASGQLAAMQKLVDDAGLGRRVFFLGALKDVDLAYQAADCLLHPTLEDTYAMVVLEAMSHGLPVVVSGPRYCGIASDLSHRQNAWILGDPADEQDIAQALETIQSDVDFANHLGSNAETFAKGHSWSQVATEYEALYRQVVFPRKQPWNA